MEYRVGYPTITRSREEALRDKVRHRVVEEVPNTTYREKDILAPFQYDTSRPTIAAALFQFATGEPRTYAVYVLECLQSSSKPATVLSQGVSTNSVRRYDGAGDARRVVYVGVAKNVLNRLDQHLNYPGEEGANFTAMYPPARILQVGWFSGQGTAEEAERITADLLREKFPQDFIAYPG